jgi:thiol-disulfide isomerase/thioredoxin
MIQIMKMHQNKNMLFYSLAILISVAWIFYTFMVNKSSEQAMFSASQKGFIAPDFKLSDINGKEYQLSDLQGKMVIVNVWASWCKPCQYEMPAMQKIYEKYSDKDLILLAVNNTYQDNLADVIEFVDVNKLTFPILLDVEGEVSNLYQVQALPSTYFIDRSGKISEIIIGGPMSETLIESKILEMSDNVPNF